MGRASRRSERVLKGMEQITPKVVEIAQEMVLPNTSGDHIRSIKTNTPTADVDLATKKYVDDNIGSGDVTAGANLTDETIVQGDGGAKGVKTSTATVAQIATNVTHVAGDGSDHADVATNTAASHAQAHTVASHSDTTATGTETETLTDNSMADALHRHSELSASDGTPDAALSLSATGVPTHTTDMDTNDTLFIPNILHGTDATPPAANTVPRGSIYIQYTA